MGGRRAMMALALAVALGGAAPGVEPVRTSDTGDVAANGYDVVAYFTDGRPVEGSAEHAFEWSGAVWRFASEGHRASFAADPERYAPAYGGYCAWAVAHGYTAETDPEAWAIVDGRLYLNYSLKVRERWNEDRATYIERADANWPGLLADD